MNRASFLGHASSFAVAGASGPVMLVTGSLSGGLRVGARTTLAQLLAAYPAPAAGDVVQYDLGFGAQYSKQIGFGKESDPDATLAFVETQVGNGDNSCNPNTLKKVFLKTHGFPNVFTPYPAGVYVTRSGSMMARWGDGVGPPAADVLLLDSKVLYDARAATIVALGHERLTSGGSKVAATRVALRYPSFAGATRLKTVELWLSPDIPLGLAGMHASVPGVDAFELSVYRYARNFKTSLSMSLATIRALTPGGEIPVLQ